MQARCTQLHARRLLMATASAAATRCDVVRRTLSDRVDTRHRGQRSDGLGVSRRRRSVTRDAADLFERYRCLFRRRPAARTTSTAARRGPARPGPAATPGPISFGTQSTKDRSARCGAQYDGRYSPTKFTFDCRNRRSRASRGRARRRRPHNG